MNKILFIILIAYLFSCSTKEPAYKISGTIVGMDKVKIKLYKLEQYKDQDFEILGVSFDNDKESWIKAIHKDGLRWPQISELNGWNNKAKEIYDNPLPGSVLISPDGIIIAKNLKHEELAKKLAEIFDK